MLLSQRYFDLIEHFIVFYNIQYYFHSYLQN